MNGSEAPPLLASSQRVSGYFPRTTIQTISASAWRRPIPGDANGDGQVDVNDLTIVLSQFRLRRAVPGRRAAWTAIPPARWTSTT